MATAYDNLKWNAQGLIPAIVQDAATGQVLMLAYMNRESLQRTLESGETWFYSRSRSRLWHKGEESGHVQKVVCLQTDCDQDTLLVKVRQMGAGACHEGYFSCFHYSVDLVKDGDGAFRVAVSSEDDAEVTFDPEDVYTE